MKFSCLLIIFLIFAAQYKNRSEMYSIIVCSVRSDDAEKLRINIENTIGEGIPVEYIAYDNRGTGKGICQVYNECAAKARYDYLCFIHEDVEFMTNGWGRIIGDKLAEDSCGVVGFVGSAMKARSLTGWNSTKKYGVRANFIQGGKRELVNVRNPGGQCFSRVVTLDGMCLFTRRDVWRRLKFDEHMLRGFHCYDLDYTIASAVDGLQNWVCNHVMIKHRSGGNIDRKWFVDTKKLHEKWHKNLPVYIEPVGLVKKKYHEFRSRIEWMCVLEQRGIYDLVNFKTVPGYVLSYPFNKKTYKFLGRWMKRRNQVKRNH